MGILGSIRKAVMSPVRRQKEEALKKRVGDTPIVAVVNTEFPENYQEYWESDGYTTEVIRGRVVVWNKNLTSKDISALKEKYLGKTI